MAKVTATEFGEKWARRLSGSTEDIRTGLGKVTESPTAKAAGKQEKMLANLSAAVRSGKWANGLKRVSLEEWKRAAIDKGVPRIASGAAAAESKMADFGAELLPHIDRGVESIKAMPDVTIEDSIARMNAFIRHMAKFTRK